MAMFLLSILKAIDKSDEKCWTMILDFNYEKEKWPTMKKKVDIATVTFIFQNFWMDYKVMMTSIRHSKRREDIHHYVC